MKAGQLAYKYHLWWRPLRCLQEGNSPLYAMSVIYYEESFYYGR